VTAETLFDGLHGPAAIDWSPDGRNMYISELRGVVKVVRDGEYQSTFVLDFQDRVNNTMDRGLMDIAVHPNLAEHPYLYLLYTYDPPEVFEFADDPLAGPDKPGNRAARLSRVTLDAGNDYMTIVPDSEVVILGRNSTWENFNGFAYSMDDLTVPPGGIRPDGTNVPDFMAMDSDSHTVGAVEFGPDGMLWVTNGDGTSFNRMDPRTVRVQDIDNLSGKLMRIDPITGAGLADNPFFDGDPESNRSKVYQLGLRNPFRIGIDRVTGQVYLGDVGWSAWEEVNTGPAGANFGWPYFEGGAGGVSLRTVEYQDLPEAQAFYAAESVVASPLVALSHSADGINAIIVGDVYRGSAYPSRYQGNLFFNDLGQGIVRTAQLDADGNVAAVETFATGHQYVVQMKVGPEGLMYFVDLDNGTVGRWRVS
jgi:glucose/arabinose dehydrogenase